MKEKNANNELSDELFTDFLFENQKEDKLSNHKKWLGSIVHEKPNPTENLKVAIYIRYYNQTKYENYLEFHKNKYLNEISKCKNWEFVDFYIDEGSSVPNMESSNEWSKLLCDCYDGKVDLIITQKVSSVSKKCKEIEFCARILASLDKPVGIYFISENIYTLASYYKADLKDTYFLNSPEKGELHE